MLTLTLDENAIVRMLWQDVLWHRYLDRVEETLDEKTKVRAEHPDVYGVILDVLGVTPKGQQREDLERDWQQIHVGQWVTERAVRAFARILIRGLWLP